MTLPRSLCALAFLALAAALSAAAAEPVFPPGSRVGLEPPPGMVPSKRFAGFEDPEHKAAILVLDMPAAAYQQVEASLFAKPQKDVVDLSRRTFPLSDGIGMLASGTAQANDKPLRKWFFLATAVAGPVPDLTAFVTVEVPEAARAVYTDAVIEKALKSITFRKAPVAEQLAMLPFRLGDLAGFHVRQVLPAGTVVLSEKEDGAPLAQAFVVVSVAPGGPTTPEDRARFAQDLIRNAPVRDLTVTSGETMRIRGVPGNEVRATAKDEADKPVSLVQWLRFGSGGFMRIVAVGPKDEWDALFPRFRALRDGIDSK